MRRGGRKSRRPHTPYGHSNIWYFHPMSRSWCRWAVSRILAYHGPLQGRRFLAQKGQRRAQLDFIHSMITYSQELLAISYLWREFLEVG